VNVRLVLLAAGCASLAAAGLLAGEAPPRSAVLGPLAPIAAQVQWVRGHVAARAGNEGRAFALMQSAVELEPRSTAAWIALADQLGLQLASAESGRSGEERAEWLRAALVTLTEGELHARAPARLALHQGLLLMSHAQTDPDIAWPGGTAQLWLDAADAFEHARDLAEDAAQKEAAAAARDFARAAAADLTRED